MRIHLKLYKVQVYFAFHFSERIHISTPNKYEYQYVKKPSRMNQFQVAVKTHNDAHFALSASPHDSAEMLEIVLGGRQNTRSWISVGKMGEPLVSVPTPGILSWDEFHSFWISWKGGVVQVRRERNHGCNTSKCTAYLLRGCARMLWHKKKCGRPWGLCVRRAGAVFTGVPLGELTLNRGHWGQSMIHGQGLAWQSMAGTPLPGSSHSIN